MGVIITEAAEVAANDSESRHRYEQQENYMKYLETHIGNVRKSYYTYIIPLLDKNSLLFTRGVNKALFTRTELVQAIVKAQEAVHHHDDSKYSDQEFEGYRAHWDPTEYEKTLGEDYQRLVDENYQEAWLHHLQNNDHHPEYWYNYETKEARDMSLDAIIHMICDWDSFNIANGGNCVKWYKESGHEVRKYMSPKTITTLEELLFKFIHPEEHEVKDPVESLTPYIAGEDNKV